MMCNAAAVGVTQQFLLAGEESGQARGPGVLQQAARLRFTPELCLLEPLQRKLASTAGKFHSAYMIKFFFSFQ